MAEENNFSLLVYDRTTNTPARAAISEPKRMIVGQNTFLEYACGVYVDPTSGLRDYRAARQAFARLLTDYPHGEWESEARTWQAALAELEAREAELVTREAEAARLKTEAVKLGADLQRLKRIDLNLERRR